MLLARLREKYHPFFWLRRSALGSALLAAMDFPLPWRFRGIAFPVWVRSVRHASFILLGPDAERRLYDGILVAATVAETRRIWDVGANIGWYSWVLLSCLPEAEAVLLEPDPVNLALLARTARPMGARAAIVAAAAGDRTGYRPFAVDRMTGATGSLVLEDTFLRRHYGRSAPLVEVRSIRLDELLGRFEPPDLLKIDVEGAERLVIAGAGAVLAEQPVVVYETSAENRDALSAHFAALGYELFDAEGYGRAEQLSPNVLAWPQRLAGRRNALLAAWRSRTREYREGPPPITQS
jgi:FkbM family methyltransferase